MPSGQEVLIATVDGSLGVISIPAPSGGFVVGNGFQVNFVNDTQHLSAILAQSSQFSITQSNTTTPTTAAPSNVVYVFFFVPWRLLSGTPTADIAYPFCTAHQAPILRRRTVLAI
jgi:hypothetical protein